MSSNDLFNDYITVINLALFGLSKLPDEATEDGLESLVNITAESLDISRNEAKEILNKILDTNQGLGDESKQSSEVHT